MSVLAALCGPASKKCPLGMFSGKCEWNGPQKINWERLESPEWALGLNNSLPVTVWN